MVIASTIDGIASNLALTLPIGLAVSVGVFGPIAEAWFVPTRTTDAVERRPEDRERDRCAREQRRAACRTSIGCEVLSANKEMERSAPWPQPS